MAGERITTDTERPPDLEPLFREAAREDLAAVGEVARASWHDTYQSILSEGAINAFLRRAYSEESLERTRSEGGLWVLEVAGEVVGYVRLRAQGKVGYLNAIYLPPEAQGGGHGRRLWAGAEGWFRARNISDVRLTVAVENHKARGFYEHLGFREVRSIRGEMFGERLDELEYALSLSSERPDSDNSDDHGKSPT